MPHGVNLNGGRVTRSQLRTYIRGKFLPRESKKPQFLIPNNKLENYIKYMKDHASICKFIGIWPLEMDLIKWIQLKWKPKCHNDLKLSVRGFLTVIFTSLEDKERILENGSYFYYNVSLFMRLWEEWYNTCQEKFMVAPVWVRLFALPVDFSDPKILEGVKNSISRFIKVVDLTQPQRYKSYAWIYVYMNIKEPLLEIVKLEYEDEIWERLDYENIPFPFTWCHKY